MCSGREVPPIPRKPRKQSPTGIYHIMVRGVNREHFLAHDQDKLRYLTTLSRFHKGSGCAIFAYCLMSNHVHLLLQEQEGSSQRFMQQVGVSFVYHHNRRYGRIGHLFQDRFRSETIESEGSLLACARYIHNNPIKAGLVSAPENYPWSSYPGYVGRQVLPAFVKKEGLLSLLGEDAVTRLVAYTTTENDDQYLDLDHSTVIVAPGPNQPGTIEQILTHYGLTAKELKELKNIALRNQILREIKAASNSSIREIASQLGLSKDMVHRA